jgi:exopolysaccharide biosynthesis polyprenyl glycosylphosphotransferase
MRQQAATRIADIRALLETPVPPATARVRRMTARRLRLGVAAVDAAQTVGMGLATRAVLPGATASDAWEALGLGVLSAALAVAVRRAMRGAAALDQMPALPVGLQAAAATAFSIGATGAICWLAPTLAAPDRGTLLMWFAAWAVASAVTSAVLRLGAAQLAELVCCGRRIIVVGPPEEADTLACSVLGAPCPRWLLAGRVDDADANGLARLAEMVGHGEADVVALQVTGPRAGERIAAVCELLADQPVRVCLALDAAALGRMPRGLDRIGHAAMVDLLADPHGGLDGAAKRAIDIVGSGLALVLLSPVLAAAALAIYLESPGPILFRQLRFGLGSRPITVLKFRSMRTDGCDATGERRTIAHDPRVTRVGRILRRSSIDELPQLINVLRGEMSLVGPRPHPLHMRVGEAYYFEAVDRYRARHLVKPGITGWAQVNGSRGEVDTLAKARRRVELDLWYLDNWSVGLDLRIMLRTALGGFISRCAD